MSPLPISISAAMEGADGQFRLFTQAGHMLLQRGNEPLTLAPLAEPSPVAGAALTADGTLALVGSRGCAPLVSNKVCQRRPSPDDGPITITRIQTWAM